MEFLCNFAEIFDMLFVMGKKRERENVELDRLSMLFLYVLTCSLDEVARLLGTTPPSVSRAIRGLVVPSIPVTRLLEEIIGLRPLSYAYASSSSSEYVPVLRVCVASDLVYLFPREKMKSEIFLVELDGSPAYLFRCRSHAILIQRPRFCNNPTVATDLPFPVNRTLTTLRYTSVREVSLSEIFVSVGNSGKFDSLFLPPDEAEKVKKWLEQFGEILSLRLSTRTPERD